MVEIDGQCRCPAVQKVKLAQSLVNGTIEFAAAVAVFRTYDVVEVHLTIGSYRIGNQGIEVRSHDILGTHGGEKIGIEELFGIDIFLFQTTHDGIPKGIHQTVDGIGDVKRIEHVVVLLHLVEHIGLEMRSCTADTLFQTDFVANILACLRLKILVNSQCSCTSLRISYIPGIVVGSKSIRLP